MRLPAVVFTVVLCAMTSSATVINFENFPNTSDGNNPAVGTTYSSLGITFNPSGQGIAAGMANGDPGGWFVNGTNGPKVLAFGPVLGHSMEIAFARAQNSVSFDVSAAGFAPSGTLNAIAYNGTSPLRSMSLPLTAVNSWSSVTFVGNGITRVTWSGTADFAVDNIVYRSSLVNGTFEDSLGVNPWTVPAANSGITGGGADIDNRAGSHSAGVADGIDGSLGGAGAFQCISMPALTSFRLAGSIFAPGGQAATGFGQMSVSFYNADDCLGTYLGETVGPGSSEPSWIRTFFSAKAPAGTQSALVGLGVFKNPGSGNGTQFIVYFDNVVFSGLRSDLDGNGSEDLVLRNDTTGQNAVWMMNATALTSIQDLPALPVQYRIQGTADFNADGQPDLLLRNTTTGQNAVWIMNGTAVTSIVDLPALADPNWHIEGTGDFNGDGSPDILWRNYSTGQDAVWVMNGTSFEQVIDLPALPNVNYTFESTGDFNSDGWPDVVLRNGLTGQNAVWLLRGTSLVGIVDLPALANTNYRIDSIGDFDADSAPDVVWRNYSTGQDAVWLMNGTSVGSIVDLPALPNTAYEIDGPR